jgi:hypothetical protein
MSNSLRCLAASSLENSPVEKEGSFTPQACPACGQKCFRPIVLERHIERCCPDLFPGENEPEIATLGFDEMDQVTLEKWLATAREKELQKQEEAVRFFFFEK